MKYLETSHDVRSARLIKTVKATLLIVGPELPVVTRRRLTGTTTAVRLLLEVNDFRGAVIALDIVRDMVKELPEELGRWGERIDAHAGHLRAEIKVSDD